MRPLRKGPSLAEGKVPDFNEVQKDIIALNQGADLQVTPSLRPGALPGTVDVDLVVKDTLPLHGSVELNNRYSPNTTPLRLNIAANYSNLWQFGHTIGVGFQIAPQRPSDALVYSGYYILPIPGVSWLSFMLQGTRQNSNVSTLGGSATAGNGIIIAGQLLFNLPSWPGFYENAAFGLSYKDFNQNLTTIGTTTVTQSPIVYWPFQASYNAVWVGKGRETDVNAGVTFSIRGLGSDQQQFDNLRYNADGNFAYFRGSLAHTQDLPLGFQAYGSIQGKPVHLPLVNSEQFAMGGLTTVRGYRGIG